MHSYNGHSCEEARDVNNKVRPFTLNFKHEVLLPSNLKI